MRAPGRRPRVRVFGEMVDLLWRGGNLPAAARLESLWNEAVATHALALFCAYGLNGEGHDGFPSTLRELHSHVLPAGSPPRLSGERAADLSI